MKAVTLLNKLKNTQKAMKVAGGEGNELEGLLIQVSGMARSERYYEKIIKEGKKGTIREAKRDLKNLQEFTNKMGEALGVGLVNYKFKKKVISFVEESRFQYVKSIFDNSKVAQSPRRVIELMYEQGVDPSAYMNWLQTQVNEEEDRKEIEVLNILNTKDIEKKQKGILNKFNKQFKKLKK